MKKGQTKDFDPEKGNQFTDNLSADNSGEGKIPENSAEGLYSDGNENYYNTAESDEAQPGNKEQKENKIADTDCEAKILEWKDKYLRLSAEFDNYRKRTLKEKIDLTKFAGEDMLKGLLPVVDDFERGMKNMEQAKDIDAIKEGMGLIYSKFKSFLTSKGLKEIESSNCDFNTDFHEAITKIPVADKTKSGKIIDIVEKGYMLDDKVVRFSKVVIGE
jgi:molecular chaperone GrpE